MGRAIEVCCTAGQIPQCQPQRRLGAQVALELLSAKPALLWEMLEPLLLSVSTSSLTYDEKGTSTYRFCFPFADIIFHRRAKAERRANRLDL